MYSYKKIYIQGHQILSRLRLQKDKTIYIGRNQNKKNFLCLHRDKTPKGHKNMFSYQFIS